MSNEYKHGIIPLGHVLSGRGSMMTEWLILSLICSFGFAQQCLAEGFCYGSAQKAYTQNDGLLL